MSATRITAAALISLQEMLGCRVAITGFSTQAGAITYMTTGTLTRVVSLRQQHRIFIELDGDPSRGVGIADEALRTAKVLPLSEGLVLDSDGVQLLIERDDDPG